MSYINTSRKSRLTINGVDESSRMVSWSANDDSLFKNGIMKTSGQVVLGTTALSQYDYQREAYKRGQIVQMELWNETIQQWEIHPRGYLYVISTAFSAEAQQVTIEIGCRLAVWTLSDNVDAMYEYSVTELSEGQRTIQNISQGLYSSNKCIYQDNAGVIQTRDIFDLSSATDASTVPALWSTGSKTEALSAAPLAGSELPDIIDLEYNYLGSEIFTEQEKTTTNTSNYDIVFNAATWARVGSGDELNSTISINESYNGQPGAAVGAYVEVIDQVKVPSSRTETTNEYFNGPGGQLTRSVQEVFLPGVEIKAEYFEDQYSACRYQAALDGDADSTSCSYMQGTSPMLSSRVITSLTYDENGTVTSRRAETWRPVLAAAQGFNWKSGDGAYGQPENFVEVSLTDLYRDTIIITDYSQNEDGDNVETITTYTSGAVEYNAGIYANTGVIGRTELSVSEPTSYPAEIQGITTLGLATEAVTGTGTGLTVNVAWSANTGSILGLDVTSSLSDCQWGIGPTANSNVYPQAARSDEEEALRHPNASALMYWGALPDNGPRLTGEWLGGSGSGFDGYVPTSSLPRMTSSVKSGQNNASDVGTWDVFVTSTDFVGASTDVIEITEGGAGYGVGDIITWTNNVTPAQQFGDAYSSLGQALVTDYGQSLSTTTITAQVTAVSLVKPLITIVDNGDNYEIGDQIRVTAAELSAATGDTITDDLLFTITSGEDGVPNLGSGIASLSQTDYVSDSESTLDQYAGDGGTVLYDFRYTGNERYPTTLVSVDGQPGSTGAFTDYDGEGESIVKAYQITPFAVRNNGMMFIDNGFIRSPGISSSYVQSDGTQTLRWESWVYVDAIGVRGASLIHWGGTSEPNPATTSDTSVPNSGNGLWGLYMKNGSIHYVTYERADSEAVYDGLKLRDDASQATGSKSFGYPTQQWFHIAVTLETQQGSYSNGKLNIFKDGELQYSETPNAITSSLGYSDLYAFTGAGGFVDAVNNDPTFNGLVAHPPAETSGDTLQVTDTDYSVNQTATSSLGFADDSAWFDLFNINNSFNVALNMNVQTVPAPIQNISDQVINVSESNYSYLPSVTSQWVTIFTITTAHSVSLNLGCRTSSAAAVAFTWRLLANNVVVASGSGNGNTGASATYPYGNTNVNWRVEFGRGSTPPPAGALIFSATGTKKFRSITSTPGTPTSAPFSWRLLEDGSITSSGTGNGSVSINGSASSNRNWKIQIARNGPPGTVDQTCTLSGNRSERTTTTIPGGPLNPDDQYVRMALSQTKLSVGDAVYVADFTPIEVDPTPAAGASSLNAGTYEDIPLVATTGSGKAASANVEIILGGGTGASGSGWDPCFVSPALPFTRDIGIAEPEGGSGSGMRVILGIGYSGETYSGKSPVVIREVADAGNGYENGDILTISTGDIESLLAVYGGGNVDNPLRFSTTPAVEQSGAGLWMFPDVVGTQFAVGDTVKMTQTALQAAGGGNAGQDITATVTAVTPERSLQNLTLDAINGGKRVVTNTSSTDSSLPNNPDTNSTPSLPTLQSKLSTPVRLDSYDADFGGKADEIEETLQVPNSYTSLDAITGFAHDYSAYLKNFVIGEGYGLRIGEAMRNEIMTSWVPMAGLRYTDERIDETFAMRADAASWGVSTEEAAVVYNGIWLGTEVGGLSPSEIIDGGNFTSNVTLAEYSDPFDGGNFTSGVGSSVNSDILDGGNFTTGTTNAGDYLDVGLVAFMQIGLSFDSATTFTFDITTTSTLPVYVDWEGVSLTEEVAVDQVTHDYAEGQYVLGVHSSSANADEPFCPLFNSNVTADKVTSVAILSGATLPNNILNAFEGCSNMTSFTISDDATISSTGLFGRAWFGCSSLTTFPALKGYRTSLVSFVDAWHDCTSLKFVPPGMFDSVTSWASANAMLNAFTNCALSAESIQNVLTSLDAVTAPFLANSVGLDGGTNASYSTWTTAAKDALASLEAKGWTVFYNS